METQTEDDAATAALTKTLNSLSIQAPEPEFRERGAQDSTGTQSLQKRGNSGYFDLSRRQSSTFAPKSPSSPRLSRRSSSNHLGKPDTPTKGSRSPSAANSPKILQRQSSFASETIVEHLTASAVAQAYLKSELELHSNSKPADVETVVIVHDSCYGHRYARPKTSKSTLSLIVERPERLQAGTLGVSCAYVRLKQLYAGGLNSPHPLKTPDTNIPFHIHRSTNSIPLTAPIVTAVHGTKWMQDLNWMCSMVESRLASGSKELGRPEDTSQVGKQKLHEGDLYLCKESLQALQGALGGVIDGVDAVFRDPSTKRAFVCIRPPGHHCSADLPSGFCWLNNVHVGIEHAAQTHGLTHAAIIDIDLHHGDGSQSITWERNSKASRAPKNSPMSKKTSIGYFSLHDINSYPCEYGDVAKVQSASLCMENAHGQSIWNVHLQPWKTDAEFWDLYRTRYTVLIQKARAFLRHHTQRIMTNHPSIQPKAAIFLSSGFDASQWEGEGMQRHGVNVPTDFYARFTSDVVAMAEEDGLSVGGRIISVLEGGYSDRALTSGVFAHTVGLTRTPPATRRESLSKAPDVEHSDAEAEIPSEWWSLPMLAELEALSKPQYIPPPPKKAKNVEPPTYTSPTQSFTAKIVDPSKIYRSISGTSQAPFVDIPSTPPIPEVDWATSAYELSKLLIPSDRRVDSYRHEELTEPRVKRERHSSIGLTAAQPSATAVQTRGRKVKPIPEGSVDDGEFALPIRPASRTTRRRTLSDLPRADEAASNTGMDGTTSSAGLSSRPGSRSSVRPLSAGTSASAATNTGPIAPVPASADADSNELNIRKTRRTSGMQTNLTHTVPPTRKVTVPKPSSKPARNSSAVAATSSKSANPAMNTNNNDANELENLTSGVKKITLKMPAGHAEVGSKPKASANPTSKAGTKPAVPKAKRTSTARTTAAKTTKSTGQTKATTLLEEAPAIGSQVDTADSIHPALNDAIESIESTATNQQVPNTSSPLTAADNMGETPETIPVASQGSTSIDSAANSFESLTQMSSDTLDKQKSSSAAAPRKTHSPSDQTLQPGFDFIHYAPTEGTDSAPQYLSSQLSSLTWLPPNTSTPAQTPVKRSREDLPVFSPVGAIPFARTSDVSEKENNTPDESSGHNSNEEQAAVGVEENVGRDIWAVPDTPTR